MIYNSDNIVVSEKELRNNMEIELELELAASNNSSFYTVQLITARFDNKNEGCDIYTYTNIEPNIWKLNGETKPQKTSSLGVNKVEFNDINYRNFHLNHIQNLGNGSRIYFDKYFYIDQHYNPDILWMSFHNAGERLFYKLIENVSLNENFTYTFSDLIQMENVIDYEIPQSTYSSVFIRSDQTYNNGIKTNFRVYMHNQYETSNFIRGYYPANLFSQYY